MVAGLRGREEPLHILLVEDNPGDRGLLEAQLRSAGRELIRLEHADDLATSLAAIREDPPELVLLDLGLPDAGGLEVLQEVLRPDPFLPVIVFTGREDQELAAQALAAGAQDYLLKGSIEAADLLRSARYAVERARARRELFESEQRYAIALAGANDGLWDWDLLRGRIHLSPRWKQMLGLREEEAGDDPGEWLRRVHPEDLPGLREKIRAHLDAEHPHFEHEYRIWHESGHYLWVHNRGMALRDASGRPTRMAGSQSDISPRKEAEERLRHEALHDGLTGLPNRAFFLELLERSLGRLRREPERQFAVLFVDLDRFKPINDSLGHAAGDALLVEVARRLELCVRPEDSVARLGGDEFTVLLEGIHGTDDAVRVARRIHEELARPVELDGEPVVCSASIGVASSETGYQQPEDFLRDADIAMYRAKGQGPGRMELFDRRMHERAVERLRDEVELRRAVDQGELALHYQPLVDLADGRLVGLEALVRWQHPARGLVDPADFVPLAEECDLIGALGQWVLREACAQQRRWRDEGGLAEVPVSVNLSAREFEGDLHARVRAALEANRLPASALVLEITESVLLRDHTRTREQLEGLRDDGLRIHIDDFGTGFSSLGVLQRFGVDALKVDRGFVASMGEGDGKRSIVRAIIELARALDLQVCAEGIESADQRERLAEMGCRVGQGFLFARAEDAEGARRWLAAGRVAAAEA